ncbi:hypothetical protein Y032_0004g2170 [Ancylostoma ceylanicum]|uniref:Uncharacterized protein n=1 Tax=Ancylostoma ceylanicum TaxID=53326 RepID=A0A016VVP3_9BILA|nr:hypothetical protein Y032_0004g2170 [Ancylostoma ceylanicum]
MQLFKPGYYRFDILILLTYQMNHFFGVQQLFPIFLNHTPKTVCQVAVCNSCKACSAGESAGNENAIDR